jgi:hypothetical protein
MLQKIVLTFIFFLGTLSVHAQGQGPDLSEWRQIKGEHFVVYVLIKEDEAAGRDVLRAAEDYYDKIARQIGYARYGNFWTWEERVKIIIFPDQVSFSVTTDQPVWSKGYAVRDSRLFESRAIVTFRQEEGFLNSVLPHEIGHLILRDFIGFDRSIPLWFDEGVAQLQEAPNADAEAGMAMIVKNREYVPFELLGRIDIRLEKDSRKVAIFYAQSRFVLEFLIKTYGQEAFQRLCHALKEGKGFSEALKNAYAPSLDSMQSLEAKWVQHMGG